jgi:hypothetical protein
MDMDYSAAREAREAPREAMKRLNVFIKREEYEDAMNKLPIDERAIIKDVLNQIKVDNHKMFLDKLDRERDETIRQRINNLRNSKRIEDAVKEGNARARAVGSFMCTGLVYVGAYILTR